MTDVTLDGRRCAAEPRPANHGIGEGRVAGKVGEALEAVIARPSTQLAQTAGTTV